MTDRWVGGEHPPTFTGVSSYSANDAATTGKDHAIKRSNGINATLFHKKKISNGKDQTQAEKQLNHLLRLASKNVVVQKKKAYSSTQNTRRDAYTAVTTLRTFPIQDLALSYLEELIMQYLGISSHPEHKPHEESQMVEKTFSSIKKQKLCSFTVEFLNEHNYRPDENNVHQYQFMPVLWSMEPRIFAEETSAVGKRKYIVGHLGRFLQQYWRERDPRSRHCYELIREGTPCRLYFDLEFCKTSNPHISSSESEVLMNEFIAELCCEFDLAYDIKIDRSCIVDLDSTTDKKFSRHLIVHLPKQQLFVDARSAGFFAKTLVERLAHELSIGTLAQKRQTLAKYLFVNSKPANPNETSTVIKKGATCFVDLSVYTRNRLFRILGSTKFGKPSSAALRIASANEFSFPNGFDNSKFYHVDKKMDRNADQRDDLEAFRAALNWDSHAEALAATLVVPANASKMKFSKEHSNIELITSPSLACRLPPLTRNKTSTRTYSGNSPMPKLDSYFLSTLGQRGGAQGKIRAWSIDYVTSKNESQNTYFLTYQMCENRWCENISRNHKSNNIMWTIDLSNSTCYQQCHDPDCRQAGFRGRPIQMNLPEDITTEVEDFILEREIACIDEKKVLNDYEENK